MNYLSQTTEDLAEADRRRREQFKEYEMEKKFEQEQKIKGNKFFYPLYFSTYKNVIIRVQVSFL